ncbi:unnamed protein product [Hyaloperonospora brassicae]|uniref:RxLR effector candidate protein n=1 Tax=Hyaloperonospora brassicae TaxID=162125 RepID=A0AAV0TXI3_HYABA|nr:unnamed protein product [Hyaloperonospora brassicae]
MRLHTFTLVVFTAVLAHSANPAKASNSTTTEGAPSASLRSSDACCDDIPVVQGPGPHETTAGEARMLEPWVAAISSVVARFVEQVHMQYPEKLAVENFPVHVLREFDESAIRHLFRLESAHMTTQQLVEHAQTVGRLPQNKPADGLRLIAEARQVFLAHEAKMGAKVHQDFFARQAEMGVETPQYFLSLQAEMGVETPQHFLADQAQTLVKAHGMILKHQEIMIADTRQDFLAHLEEMTAEARRSFLGIQVDLTAEAHKYVRAHVAKTTAQARDFFLANQAEMTAETRDSFLAHQAELTAKATQSFLANQARMTAEAHQFFLANQAELTAKATQSFLANQARMTAEAIMRHEMDPSAYFDIKLQEAGVNPAKQGMPGREGSHVASLDLGSLDKYMKEYDELHGSNELTLLKVMSRCIRDDAKLKSTLSTLNRNRNNKKYVRRVVQEMSADWMTLEEAAVNFGIPLEKTGVLDAENVDLFILFVGMLARDHKDQHSIIAKQLTEMFGVRQAASLVQRMDYCWRC